MSTVEERKKELVSWFDTFRSEFCNKANAGGVVVSPNDLCVNFDDGHFVVRIHRATGYLEMSDRFIFSERHGGTWKSQYGRPWKVQKYNCEPQFFNVFVDAYLYLEGELLV